MAVRTLDISAENSTVEQEQFRILANGNQANLIDVVVRSEEGIPLRGLSVELVPDKDWVAIRRVRDITGQEGNAQYEISSQQSGKVTFEVQVQSEIGRASCRERGEMA